MPEHSSKNSESNPQLETQEAISKTQKKQAAEELKKLGLELVDLTKGERDKIPLDDELLTAIELCARINRKKDGFRRQIQLIGKMLRARDLDEIESAINKLKYAHTEANRHFHHLELLRDMIIKEGDQGINKVVSEHEQLERQKLRQLLRLAQKQKLENKPPAAAREIFQYLKSQIPH